jgi:hypothetical protein
LEDLSSRSPGRHTALAVFATLLVLYSVTLARGVTFWDSGEFLAAIHSLGIPHPPGTPLFIMVANVWAKIVAPLMGFTIAVNALSAVCTAAACALLADLMRRWTRDPLAAWAAAICAGTMSTVWLNATESEVYAVSILIASIILWCGDRAVATGNSRYLLLVGYIAGLGWALHLTALLTIPAALIGVILARRRIPNIVAVVALFVLGASAVLFLIVRAQHDPAINQGNPATWTALWQMLQRHQYEVAPLWPRRAPLWLQLGNVIEYADWQLAFGFAPVPWASWRRTPITVLFVVAALYGAVMHRRVHRPSWRVLLGLFVTTTLGVAIYLNLRMGPSFGYGFVANDALREARERDYFFTLGFVCWGLWAGYGLVTAARKIDPRLAFAGAVLSSTAVVGNWRVIHTERVDEQRRAEQESIARIQSIPQNGVYLARGDNDTYPLWYLQEVQRMRRDVTVIVVPLLGASWYRAEVMRRHDLITDSAATHWQGTARTVDVLRARAVEQGRSVVDGRY